MNEKKLCRTCSIEFPAFAKRLMRRTHKGVEGKFLGKFRGILLVSVAFRTSKLGW